MFVKASKIASFVFLFLALSSCSKQADFEISNLVIRETPPGASKGVAYLTLVNNMSDALVLNYVHSPRVSAIEVHRHLYEDGMMRMREIKHLTIDPHQRLDFTPGGYHLMLFGLDARFEEGQEVPITFEFENKEAQTHIALVRRL